MRCGPVTLAVVLLCAPPAAAHQEDTSYTRIHLEAEQVTTEATFDLHVLSRIVEIDRDGDEAISREELLAAAPMAQAYLQDRIGLSLDDGRPDLGTPQPPVWPDEISSADAIDWPQTLIDFPFVRAIDDHPDLVTLAYSTWPELGSSHTNLTSIEQTGYERLEIVFSQTEPDYDYFTEAPASPWSQFSRFVRLGAEHIWAGLDHVLFLVALLVMSRLSQLLQIITAFTVAHSITLALAVLEIVEVPSRLVEAGIAATIVWVAYQNLRGRGGAHRWRLTFAFGLVHGFGFAGVLRELELPASSLLRSLAGFNIGVELGQVALVTLLFPVFALLTRTRFGQPAIAGVSAAVGVAGVVWVVERVFAP
ncbi:MAG: HupE/UreJ family protein [Candidatus Binatia bacterium]|nr:HupE/UreJ family protein [Candidatus Binatia bacterium]